MNAPRWLLITVSDPSPESRANLRMLLDSVERQGVAADMVLVMRGSGEAPESATVRIHQVDSPTRIALSAARNLALEVAAETSLLAEAAIVAFPDDDANYPEGLLGGVAARLTGAVSIACGPYAPTVAEVDKARFPVAPRMLGPEVVMRAASSNNVFLRTEVVRKVGRFDERFGLGASYGAGEDSDYLLRALRQGYTGTYDPSLIVLHPYKAHRPTQYYPGNVAVLARHCRGGGTTVLLARRLASGLLMTAQRRLSVRDYLGVVRGAIGLVLRDGAPALPIGSDRS
jgi:hypothetical protein